MTKRRLLSAVAVSALVATSATANTSIGSVAALNRDVAGTPPQAETRTLVLGDGLFSDELIESSAIGSGQFMFLDQTTLTIAKNSSLVLDKYVYDPETKTGEFAINMTRGVLRFVGGRITKTTDAVVTTPTATIGIRGGMTIIIVEEDGTTRVMHIAGEYTRVTRIGGDEIIISRNNGVTVVPGAGAAGAAAVADAEAKGVSVDQDGIAYLGVADRRLVRQTSQLLIGRGEAGAKVAPQESDIIASGVPAANSQAKGAKDAAPVSTKGEAPNRGEDGEEREAQLLRDEEEITGALLNRDVDVEPPNPPVRPRPPQPPTNQPVLLPGVTGGASIANSSVPGLAAGGGQSFVFTQVFEGSRIGVTAAEEVFIIPVEEGFFSFDATTGASPVGGIAGNGFHDSNAEFTYAVFETTGGRTGSFLTGAPSGALAAAGAGTKRAVNYTVSRDLFSNQTAPFAPAEAQGFSADGASDLTLLSNVGGAQTGGDARAVMTYLDINGQGAGQTSSFGVLTGSVEADANGAPKVSAFFDGSFTDGQGGATRFETPVATLEDGVGGAAFGPNAQYLALTNNADFTDPDAISGRSFDPEGGDAAFGTNNFANRTSTNVVASAGATTGTPGGFAAVSGVDLGTGGTFVGRSNLSGGVRLTVTPGTNDVTAQLQLNEFFSSFDGEVFTRPEIRSLRAEFGGDDRGAAIDADRFAARHSADAPASANGVQGLPGESFQGGQNTFSGAFASAALAGDGGVFPAGVSPTSEVLKWGWWAGEFRHDPAEVGNPDNEGAEISADQRFHLGAWVAGDLSGAANLPQVGVASYEGFAIVSAVQNGQSIVDGAGFGLTYDFGQSVGTARFTDILGANAEIGVNAQGIGATYSGTAGINIGGQNGLISVDGTFFNGRDGTGAAGTGGSLSVATNNGAIQGTGVFAGDRTQPDVSAGQ